MNDQKVSLDSAFQRVGDAFQFGTFRSRKWQVLLIDNSLLTFPDLAPSFPLHSRSSHACLCSSSAYRANAQEDTQSEELARLEVFTEPAWLFFFLFTLGFAYVLLRQTYNRGEGYCITQYFRETEQLH
jgi:hypothetical protein